MSIDPKVLKSLQYEDDYISNSIRKPIKRKPVAKPVAEPPEQFDGEEGEKIQDDLPHVEGTAVPFESLPQLIGSPKQIKWAESIRQDALDQAMPKENMLLLTKVVDASWWIVNSAVRNGGDFKKPLPNQLAGAFVRSREQFPDQAKRPPGQDYTKSDTASDSRVSDAENWAHSVSQCPKLAEAAILAVLSKLYKGEMKEILRAKATVLIQQAVVSVDKDVEAINKMISS